MPLPILLAGQAMVLGRARAFLLGVAGFALASLLGGLAPSAPALIGARALQGAAGALMTPQVLSIIQSDYHGERRARAIGAYSMILAAGVAAGQVAGGLLVGAHLLPAAWRPALLINAPVGGALLIAGRRALRAAGPSGRVSIDAGGIVLFAGTLLAPAAPLTLGRDERWPDWVWPSLGASVAGAAWFARHARAVAAAGRRVYALGLAVASLSWARLGPRVRAALPVAGQIAMGAALSDPHGEPDRPGAGRRRDRGRLPERRRPGGRRRAHAGNRGDRCGVDRGRRLRAVVGAGRTGGPRSAAPERQGGRVGKRPAGANTTACVV